MTHELIFLLAQAHTLLSTLMNEATVNVSQPQRQEVSRESVAEIAKLRQALQASQDQLVCNGNNNNNNNNNRIYNVPFKKGYSCPLSGWTPLLPPRCYPSMTCRLPGVAMGGIWCLQALKNPPRFVFAHLEAEIQCQALVTLQSQLPGKETPGNSWEVSPRKSLGSFNSMYVHPFIHFTLAIVSHNLA